MSLQIKYYGVRGSLPVSGPEFARFGGNTTCCYVQHKDTRIVIDAGTGIRILGLDLMASELPKTGGKLHLLFTHTHWDHIQGFPFFIPAFLPNVELSVYGETKTVPGLDGNEETWDIERVLRMQQHFMYFPVGTKYMSSIKNFHAINSESRFRIGEVEVSCFALHHPNSTLAFRFDADGKSFVFSTDVEHNDDMIKRLSAFAQGADALAYDCQYTTAEYEAGKIGWGHSTYESAIEICKRGNIKNLHMIHHDPLHTDNTLLSMEADAKSKFPAATMIPESFECTL
ncbi:MAG TPA: MBL fold metallo-hydrolase [Turneriella sp.]|nr:MBL fold metallo-hydrolase [Turneriella sp.]HMY11831.1 MBL fold metallo-hydrolase [Turneriella sp.]HNE20315.1 MBL fold metallo-hydrolase [Turneriella sp.]HNJ67146.1 MBL fold metallo-hydrolase [Turneriella sp.]HNL09223.1 MBL fold metallo-hydrolase [Turneriella sp.]